MLHREVGGPEVAVLLVAVAVQRPMLVGQCSQMVRTQSQKQQVEVPQQEPERPAG